MDGWISRDRPRNRASLGRVPVVSEWTFVGETATLPTKLVPPRSRPLAGCGRARVVSACFVRGHLVLSLLRQAVLRFPTFFHVSDAP